MIMVEKAVQSDAVAIWEILEPVLRAGDVYLLPSDWTREKPLGYWFPHALIAHRMSCMKIDVLLRREYAGACLYGSLAPDGDVA